MKIRISGELQIALEDGTRINPRMLDLLAVVEDTRSLHAATRQLGVSYSHAWNALNKIGCALPEPLLITRRGGNGGGVAELTPTGMKILSRYRGLCEEYESFMSVSEEEV